MAAAHHGSSSGPHCLHIAAGGGVLKLVGVAQRLLPVDAGRPPDAHGAHVTSGAEARTLRHEDLGAIGLLAVLFLATLSTTSALPVGGPPPDADGGARAGSSRRDGDADRGGVLRLPPAAPAGDGDRDPRRAGAWPRAERDRDCLRDPAPRREGERLREFDRLRGGDRLGDGERFLAGERRPTGERFRDGDRL
eukprot:CAMPEP_0197930306 /NCGR_PEP_ID=MMETSP1439-20131203/105246_1 /TAXON_ID=66791 /ORGANISM="Gonyaulax spinifera, Strain CCMP409" /LENGTH=192 /DNA_ID=CAMNT_0043552993 /DNA_START=59 /DNA_END=635 /DNA_ORIENTATION=-